MKSSKALSWAALSSALVLTIGCKLLPDNDWPEPYTEIAKAEVRAPIDIQVTNARIQEQTLWDYHFDPRTERLNSTGWQRLRWIAGRARQNLPIIYVAATDDAELNQRRIARVKAALDDIVGKDAGLEVVQSNATPVDLPGRHVENIFKKMGQGQGGLGGSASQPSGPKPPTN